MRNITIDYDILKKAGFDEKTCSVSGIEVPNLVRSEVQEVYVTGAAAPECYHIQEQQEIVTFTVEFIPNEDGKKLLPVADKLVKDVLGDKYKPAPAIINVYKKDGGIEETTNINDTMVKAMEIKMNRKDEAAGEPGFVRIVFTLEGLIAPKKK